MRKNIGVILRPDLNEDQRIVFKINDAIRLLFNDYEVNILPICVKSEVNYFEEDTFEKLDDYEVNFDKENMDYLLSLCDGIILPGGYGPFDYDLYIGKYAHEKDIPTLGICLGMQTMGLILGGELKYIDKPNYHNSKEMYRHSIDLKSETYLRDVLESNQIEVNSRHKEELVINEEFISARDNNVVEAIEDKSKRFFVGLQWHPEDLNDSNTQKIITEFVNEVLK